MHRFEFDPAILPDPADVERADVRWDRFLSKIKGDEDLEGFAGALREDDATWRLVRAVFGNSPFLSACWLNDPHFARTLIEDGPDAARDAVLDAARTDDPERDQPALMRHLRILKRRIALTAAVGDLAGVWKLETLTRALSDFAAAAVSAACAFQLRQLDRRGKITLKHPDDPERASGLVVLGMGKLGGRELNYSSDIDLIVLFDPERIDTDDEYELGPAFVRLAKGLVEILDKRTEDGYVFRTDLRLRPDPGSTPLAMSTLAAEVYYESIGQNWERAAMIKARAIAGDLEAGEDFLRVLKPFIWRKSLDFAAIQDIHSIKRQINAHKGGAGLTLKGHNVKLGRGGIREIEFYAQTQQLIWGGRQRELRLRPTVDVLGALVEADHDTAENAHALIQAYKLLRKVEHRLQMIDDAQTHTLPDDDAGLARVATFLGYADADAMEDALLATFRKVEDLYAALFADADGLSDDGGNLVFTGGESDPETLKTLREMGYQNAEAVDGAIRGWHHGRYRAMRSTRARELLTELMPSILKAMSRTAEPDQAFLRFDQFLSQLPAGVQLFSMFQSNPHMLDLIADIMGTAPRLASHLASKAGILDAVLEPGFLDDLPGRDDLARDLEHVLGDAAHMEEVLDQARRWAKDQKFRVGLMVLNGAITERQSQAQLTHIADVLLNALQPRVEADFAKRHGHVPGGALAVVAFGKLGGREKTPTSDMDLIFVYDCDEGADASDGDKPLAVSQYFARLSQRLINALSAPTAEGDLYEVDMRLRPSGNAGPIATSLKAFERYQNEGAWTWEHMALTRSRVVTGPASLREKIEGVIKAVLARPRDAAKLVVDVADMRRRIDQAHHTDVVWSIKHYRGGLVDVEFLSQYLQLAHAHDHPDVLDPNTQQALENLKAAGILDAADAEVLIEALDLWQSLQGLLRLTIDAPAREQDAYAMPESLKRRVAALTDSPGVEAAAETVKDKAARVAAIFQRLIDDPADAKRAQVQTDLNA